MSTNPPNQNNLFGGLGGNSSFNFSANPTTTQPNTGFNFGQTATGSQAPSFNFGQTASTTQPLGFQPAQAAAPQSFGLGPTNQPAPQSFGFGQTAQPVAPQGFGLGQTNQPAPRGFGIGQSAQAVAPQGFGLGQTTQPVASSGFGQTAQPVASPGFGQTAQPVASPGFGQTAQPVASPGFGLGQTAQPVSSSGFGLGQTAQPVATPGFGLGQTTQTVTPQSFGQTTQPVPQNFGQTTQSTAVPTFGIGQATQPAAPLGFGLQTTQPATQSGGLFGPPTTAAPSAGFPFNPPTSGTTPFAFGATTAAIAPTGFAFGGTQSGGIGSAPPVNVTAPLPPNPVPTFAPAATSIPNATPTSAVSFPSFAAGGSLSFTPTGGSSATNTTSAPNLGFGGTLLAPKATTTFNLGQPAVTSHTSIIPPTTSLTLPKGTLNFAGAMGTTTTPSSNVAGVCMTTASTVATSTSNGLLPPPTISAATPSIGSLSFSGLGGASTTATSTTGLNLTKTTSSGLASILKPTTAAAPLLGLTTTTLTTSATAGAPSVNVSMNFRQLEESLNKWTVDLEEQEKAFLNQATQVNAWDHMLINNGEKIIQLNEVVERVKLDQQQLDHELDFILSQQKELEALLDPLEHSLENIITTDTEREHTYQMAENIDAQLKRMAEDLKEVIEHLNAANKPQNSQDPMVKIGCILNAHTDSLQWIDHHCNQLDKQLQDTSRSFQVQKKEQEQSFYLAYN